MKILTIETTSLKKWVVLSSVFMAALFLMSLFTYGGLNSKIYELENVLTTMENKTPDFQKENINRNIANLWLSNLDGNEENFFRESTQSLGTCWLHPVENKFETIKLTVSPDWLGFEYPEGYQLTLSKKRPPQCYFSLLERPDGTTVWEPVDECNELCRGVSFVDIDEIIREGENALQEERKTTVV